MVFSGMGDMRALALFGVALWLSSVNAKAETVVTPYLSLGAYYLVCMDSRTASGNLCKVDPKGSRLPGTIELGFTATTKYIDRIEFGYKHLSFINRRTFLGYQFGGHEITMEMVGLEFTWEFESLQFRL